MAFCWPPSTDQVMSYALTSTPEIIALKGSRPERCPLSVGHHTSIEKSAASAVNKGKGRVKGRSNVPAKSKEPSFDRCNIDRDRPGVNKFFIELAQYIRVEKRMQ